MFRSALMVGSLLAMAGAAQAQFWNLGFTTPYGVSGNGSVVAGYNEAGYFIWTPQGGIGPNIGGVDPNFGGGKPDVSSDGKLIAGTDFNPVSQRTEAALYSVATGTWQHLGGIGGDVDNSISSGWGISGDGSKVVGLGWTAGFQAHAVQWTSGTGLVDMGSTVPGRSSRANATSFDGGVIAGWQDTKEGVRAGAIWENGVQTIITNDTGGQLGEATEISGNGVWAVGGGGFNLLDDAYRWSRDTGAISLGRPAGIPAGFGEFWSGSAVAADFTGDTIVGYYRPFGPPIFGRGFIWTSAGGIVDLTDYVNGLGIDTFGRVLALPLNMSDDGRTIVGIDSFGQGFVVTIPTPGVTSLALVGLAASVRRRRN